MRQIVLALTAAALILALTFCALHVGTHLFGASGGGLFALFAMAIFAAALALALDQRERNR